MSLTLVSSDAQSFAVERAVIKHAGTIETLVSNMGLDDEETKAMPIPLPNVTGRILGLVIKWLEQHKDDPVVEETDEAIERKSEEIPVWDSQFIGALPDQSTLFAVVLAANYLDIKRLLDYTCKSISNQIKGKKTEELRAHFNIENDFTPEEEEQIRKENAWCED